MATSISGAASTVGPIGGVSTFDRDPLKSINVAAPILPIAQDSALKPEALGVSTVAQVAAPILSGIGASEGIVPTTSSGEAVTQSILSGATGAVSGALAGAAIGAAGGPVTALGGAIIGGVTGLVAGGVKAFFGLKNARAKDRAQKRLIEKAEKQRDKELAIDQKWKQTNRLDNLKTARFNRNQIKMQNKWTAYQNVQGNLFNMANRKDAAGQNIRNQLRGVS